MAHHDPINSLVSATSGLAQLNERSRDIFRQIVENYLATGEPVGSRNISRLITVPLSPASVRNVMSDLEQLGLIYAPHTSAGRLPTERGLRFFVDALMQVGDLTEAERQSIQSQLASVGRAQSVEAALDEALTRLSGLSRAAAVVLTQKSNARLKHIEFVRLEPEQALVVLVAEDGQVENRVLPLPPGVPTSALTEASNFLNTRIRGHTLAEVRAELEAALTQSRNELDQLTQKVIAAGIASWSGGGSEERQLIVRGHANLLEDLHAMEDLERVRLLFDDLGYTNDEIALFDIGVGFWTFLIGIFVGGILYARMGLKRSVLLSLILMGVSNFSFALLAMIGHNNFGMAGAMGEGSMPALGDGAAAPPAVREIVMASAA